MGKNETMAQNIMRRIMFELGYDNVTEFSVAINVNYMQIYNCLKGRTRVIPYEVRDRIVKKFPQVNKDFLYNMVGEPLRTVPVPQFQENEETPKPREEKELTNADIFNLLNRVTILLDKVQYEQTKLFASMQRIEQLEKNYRELIKLSKNSEN